MACGCNKSANARTMVDTPQYAAAPPERTVDAPGQQSPGWILAIFLPLSGAPTINGRSYPLMLRGEEWWVHPDDVATRPNWWRAVDVPEPEFA